MRVKRMSSGTLVAIVLVGGAAGGQEPANHPRRQLLREHALQERALRQYLGHDVLLSESVGIEGQDLQQAVVPSPTRGDVDIARIGSTDSFGTALLQSLLGPLLVGEKGLPW